MFREEFKRFIHDLQDQICLALEQEDGKALFEEDAWERLGGGGGKTRVIRNGDVFEKGGVNTSVVFGELPEILAPQAPANATRFFACGISLVLHPINPLLPTTHANYRYFELQDEQGKVVDSWFGGGADLTPYYVDEADALHFHRTHKEACDVLSPAAYADMKAECDRYFFNSHRGEGRGIGGIFFDHLKPNKPYSQGTLFQFASEAGQAFLKAYLPIVQKHKNKSFTPEQKAWQELRRGRYVEFNLLHDRGTLFGLKTNGRTESILMSLPPVVRWDYQHMPLEGSEEARLIEVLEHPVNWIEYGLSNP